MNAGALTDQVAIGTRITVAAKAAGHSADAMLQQLAEVAGGLVDPVAWSDADVRTFGVATALADDKWLARRMASLATGISGSKALARAIVARSGTLRIERMIGAGGTTAQGVDGVSASLEITSAATLQDDVDAAIAIGVPEAIAPALARRLAAVQPDVARRPRLVRVTVYSNPAGRDSTIELATELADLANLRDPELAVTAAQLRLLERVHPILAAGQPVWVRCGVSAGALDLGATLVYANTPLDNAPRVVNGLATSEGAELRFSTLVAAVAADRTSTIELAIGPIDPIRLRVGLGVRA
jgi:hypothetical protein